MLPRARSFAALLFLLVTTTTISARAEDAMTSLSDGRAGTIWFASQTPAGADQYLSDFGAAPAVVVSGVLAIPEGAAGRVPAVVTSHSAGGVSRDRDVAWADWFATQGIGSFVVDSFGPRGVKGFSGQPSIFATVADQFAALRLAPVCFVAEGGSLRGCDAEYDTDTRAMKRLDTGAIVPADRIAEYYRSCSARGVHLGGDRDAREGARQEVAAFIGLLRQR